MRDFFTFFKFSFCFLKSIVALIALLSFTQQAGAVSQTILINEVMYDPAGTDTGYEWIELYNTLDETINIDGWSIQVAGTSFKTSTTLSGQIPPESFFLVCEQNIANCDLTVSKLAFQNGGGATDGIQILDLEGKVIDAVFYDSPNSNNLSDENGLIVESQRSAGTVGSGESLGRKTTVDTDNYANDFVKFTLPSPGVINLSEPNEGDEGEEQELEQTGSNPALALISLLSFILLTHSAKLINTHNFKRHRNAKS